MFLVRINNLYNEANLANALMKAFPEYEYLLSFNNAATASEYMQAYPKSKYKYTSDHDYIMLNGQSFEACFTFGGASVFTMDHVLNSIYAGFCQESGIPCIDIQHGFFQYGLNKIDKAQQAGHSVGAKFSLPLKTMAEHRMLWSGENGIGYLKSEQEITSATTSEYNASLKEKYPKGYVLIVSNTHSPTYTEDDKYKYLYAISRFVKKHSELKFILKPHKGEVRSKADVLSSLKELVGSKKLRNLTIIEDDAIPLAALIQNATCAISSLSSTMVSLDILAKPTFMFQTDSFKEMANKTIKSVKAFEVYDELENLYAEFKKSNPESFVPDTGIERLNADNFRAQLKAILDKPKSGQFHVETALKYIEARTTIFTNFRLDNPKPQGLLPTNAFAVYSEEIVKSLDKVNKRLKIAESSLMSQKMVSLFKKAK